MESKYLIVNEEGSLLSFTSCFISIYIQLKQILVSGVIIAGSRFKLSHLPIAFLVLNDFDRDVL